MTTRSPFVAFLSRVLTVKLEAGQSVFWQVACDGVQPSAMRGRDVPLARAIFGAVDTIPSECRHTVACVKGARVGFSYIGALRLLHLALTVSLDTMAPGESAAGIIVAPDLRLARQAFRFALGAAKATASIRALIEAETTDSMTLRRPDGRIVEIVCLPATAGGRATRGRTLVGALLDEASFFRDENYAVNDTEVFKAVAPRIVPGGQCLIGSTPWLEGVGLLATLYASNYGAPQTAIAAHLPTAIARTDRAILSLVTREYIRDPDNAKREYGAEFLSGGTTQFFDSDLLAMCTDSELYLPDRKLPGASVHAGADFGFTRNSSALAIVQCLDRKCWLSELIEVKPAKGKPLQPSAVGATFTTSLQGWKCGGFVADGHYREAVREHTAPLSFTDAPAGRPGKVEVFVACRNAMREGRVRIPAHAKLLKQLREVVSKPLPGGELALSAPQWRSGEHGDLTSAFVLAVWAATRGRKVLGHIPFGGCPVQSIAEGYEHPTAVKIDQWIAGSKDPFNGL